MTACGSCAGGCELSVRAAYARAGWLALGSGKTTPDCPEWRERYYRGGPPPWASPRPLRQVGESRKGL